MPEVSREAATQCPAAGRLGGKPALAGGSNGVFDLLVCDSLGDVGVHCPSLSIESCFSTAIRMN